MFIVKKDGQELCREENLFLALRKVQEGAPEDSSILDLITDGWEINTAESEMVRA